MVPKLVRVSTVDDWRDYHAVRRSVLWKERGKLSYDENHSDEFKPSNHPLLLRLDKHGIGTTRLDQIDRDLGIVRLVAIDAKWRHQGYGKTLSVLVDEYARSLEMSDLLVNAAPGAEKFYQATGWRRLPTPRPELAGGATTSIQMQKSLSHMRRNPVIGFSPAR